MSSFIETVGIQQRLPGIVAVKVVERVQRLAEYSRSMKVPVVYDGPLDMRLRRRLQ